MDSSNSPLGTRGLIIYDPKNGNDKQKNQGYFFVPESEWRASPTNPPKGVTAGQSVLSELSAKPRQLLVDLNLLKGLAKPAQVQNAGTVTSTGHEEEIFIHEDKTYYVVPRSKWHPLDESLSRATAQVLVKRGAVVAAIPPNPIPVGAYCVLINIDALE